MSEEPYIGDGGVPCPECNKPMTLAPGIDWFCTTPGCEKKKMLAAARNSRQVTITLTISERDPEGTGIRIRGAEPYSDIYLAGKIDAVLRDLGPVLRVILSANHNIEWLMEST